MTLPVPRSRVLSTYHDVADGWYLQLPEGWPERVWVGRSASPDEIGITFYTDSSREESCVPGAADQRPSAAPNGSGWRCGRDGSSWAGMTASSMWANC